MLYINNKTSVDLCKTTFTSKSDQSMSFISNFFIKCSGANKEILAGIPVGYKETEKTKFVGIGGAIFFTACLAFISSAFALNTFVKDIYIGDVVIDKLVICISFGLVWAFMIFNLDRYIVSSMRKEGSIYYQLVRAIPRILIALLFAVVISKPLEMEIFRTEIEAQLPQSANKQTAYIEKAIDSLSTELVRLRNENDTLRKNPFDSQFVQFANNEFETASSVQDSLTNLLSPEIREIKNKIYELEVGRSNARAKIRQFDIQIENLEAVLNDTVNIVSNRYLKEAELKKLKGDRYRERLKVSNANAELPPLRNERNSLIAQLDSTQVAVTATHKKLELEKKEVGTIVKDKIAKNNFTILDIEKRIQSLETQRKLLNDKFTGLLARLKALDDLKSAEGNFVILIASTLVFLIFMAIETAPVFVKLMSKRTMYDEILETYEMPIPDKGLISEKIHGFFKEDARLIKKKKKILREFYAKKLALQKDFLNKSLAKIKEDEVAKFEKNVDEYSSYVTDNPDTYLQTFKSSSSPITRKDGSLVWEDEGVLKRSFFEWLSWKYAAFIGLGLVLIISIVLGINHFTNNVDPGSDLVKEEASVNETISEATEPQEKEDSSKESEAKATDNTSIQEPRSNQSAVDNTNRIKREEQKKPIPKKEKKKKVVKENSVQKIKPEPKVDQKKKEVQEAKTDRLAIKGQDTTFTAKDTIVSAETASSKEIEEKTPEKVERDTSPMKLLNTIPKTEIESVQSIQQDTFQTSKTIEADKKEEQATEVLPDFTETIKSAQSIKDTTSTKVKESKPKIQKDTTAVPKSEIEPSGEKEN